MPLVKLNTYMYILYQREIFYSGLITNLPLHQDQLITRWRYFRMFILHGILNNFY